MKNITAFLWFTVGMSVFSQTESLGIQVEDPYTFRPLPDVWLRVTQREDTLYYHAPRGVMRIPYFEEGTVKLAVRGYEILESSFRPHPGMRLVFTPRPLQDSLPPQNAWIEAYVRNARTLQPVPEGTVEISFGPHKWSKKFSSGSWKVQKNELPPWWWQLPSDAYVTYRVAAQGFKAAEITDRVALSPLRTVFSLEAASPQVIPTAKVQHPPRRVKKMFEHSIAFPSVDSTACNRLPSLIRVGINCDCNDCQDVILMNLEIYVQRGLNDEWIASWHEESLKAGSLPYRTYGAYYVFHPIDENYDISNTACKQVWDDDYATSCYLAARATRGKYLETPGGAIAFSEYSAENNCLNPSSSYPCSCGDGYAGNGTDWPCIEDTVCRGYERYGHGRGMCQWGSSRWADAGREHTWIADHYYNPGDIYRCGTEHPHPDLEVLNPLIVPDNVVPGTEANASVVVRNPTDRKTDKSLINVYLSADTLGPTGPALDSTVLWPLEAWSSVTKNFHFTLPDNLNDYEYILFVADPRNEMYETDESDNIAYIPLGGGQGVGEDALLNAVYFYPNPMHDYLHIELPSAVRIKEIKIFDLAGRKLKDLQPHNPFWNVSFLSPGVYAVYVSTADGRKGIFKILKH